MQNGQHLTSADELFGFSELPFRDVLLPNGKIARVKALTVDEFDQINPLFEQYGGSLDSPGGNLFSVCTIVIAVVHPETGVRLFKDTDVPRIRDEMPFQTFRVLIEAFEALHGSVEQEDELDPVKKPNPDSQATDASSTA